MKFSFQFSPLPTFKACKQRLSVTILRGVGVQTKMNLPTRVQVFHIIATSVLYSFMLIYF